MKPLNLQKPIDISQIPKDLPGNSYKVIMQEINLRNELLYLENQSGMPDETVFVAAFSHSFYASYEGGKFIFENGSSNGYEQCLICSDNNGCTVIYAGKVEPNNCRL
jgi:hypothetical protein